MRKYLPLILIIVLAGALRLFNLSGNPPSLNWDEISHGYNAYSLLTTGKDEWGVTLPTIFRAFGDYKLPVYIYLTALSEFFFGVTALAVRLPSVIAGIGTVIFTYLLILELFRNLKSQALNPRVLAAGASFLVAVEPWTLFLSRAAFEANVALFFIVSGTYFFLRSFKKIHFLVPSLVLFGLSLWSYNSARIFVPLFVATLFLIYKNRFSEILKEKKYVVRNPLLVVLVFFVPMIVQLVNPDGLARYSKVSIIDEGAIAQIIESRQNPKYSPLTNRLLYNKATYFGKEFVKNFFSYFSPEFLFFKGGSQYQFSVPDHGLIYLINLPFFAIGLWWLVKKRSQTSSVLLAWLFLGPIAGSVTREAPHVLRAVTMLPIPMIISALGFLTFLSRLKENQRQLTALLYILCVLAFGGKYLANYFEKYRQDYSWSWQYGYKEAVSYVRENYDNYAKVIVTKKYGEPHEFFLFWNAWDAEKYRSDPKLNRFHQSGWYWVDGFDKFYFVNDWEVPKSGFKFVLESKGMVDCKGAKCVLIASPGNVPSGWELVETINFLDGKPAFEIYTN